MTLRIWSAQPLAALSEMDLEPGAVRHVQVRRLQPGEHIQLFDGSACEWPAEILHIARQAVRVRLAAPQPVARESGCAVTLAVGMPANDRMDDLVEKATELGVAAIQPLQCERSVLRLNEERAERRRQHWQGVAQAAAEQSGRTALPEVAPVLTLAAWLRQRAALATRAAGGAAQNAGPAYVLSLQAGARPLAQAWGAGHGRAVFLSGPEGGLSVEEESLALAAGFQPVTLGPRVLRADTAPLAALAYLQLHHP